MARILFVSWRIRADCKERCMAITFENALGVHPEALNFRVQRTKVLASNLANVDTLGTWRKT